MTHNVQILTAFLDRKQIQYKVKDSNQWSNLDYKVWHYFDFKNIEYRLV